MIKSSKLGEARTTCEGLHRLIRQLNGAAVDVDKGGASAHELLALLATTNECVNSLSGQLEALESSTTTASATGIRSLGIVDDLAIPAVKSASNG